MNDIASDFACLKVSALKKASRISDEVDRITIGPNSVVNENENDKSKNIKNEQNSCNISVPQKCNRAQNKTPTQSGITFSVKKILLESENQRKEEVRKEIERHWQHMKENGKAIQEHMALSRLHMAKERERKNKENYAYILAEERIAQQEEISRRNEQQREVEEYRKTIKEKEESTKEIMNLSTLYSIKYHEIVTMFKNCKDKDAVAMLLSSYFMQLEEMHYEIQLLDEKMKVGEVTLVDLNVIQKIVHQCDELLCIVKTEVDRINHQYEANIAIENNAMHSHIQSKDVQKKAASDIQIVSEAVIPEHISISDAQNDTKQCLHEEKQKDLPVELVVPLHIAQDAPVAEDVDENASATVPDTGPLNEFIDKEPLQTYISSQKLLENYMNNLAEFLQSTAAKKFRFECQKAINIPVNAISGINEQHLRDKYERLHSLLTGTSSPNVNQYPHGVAFCKNILAKKIVNQGETLVSSKPKMAFPIAAIVVAIWSDHSDFGDLLLSYFYNICPFTVPLFMPKMVGQPDEDYYKLMGYKYAEDGTVEKHDKFLKRMSGLVRLYASIIITPQRGGVAKSHPHGLQNAWRWLAAVLNIEPRKDISDLCATILLDMLEVAGNALWTAYPKQFGKLLILLSEEYYPRMRSVGCIGGGPLVRLEEFLRNSLEKASIPPPDGQLPPNFW